MSLETDDPTLAVVIERLTRFGEDLKNYREEHAKSLEAIDKSISDMKENVSKIESVLTKVKGGYIALAAVGGVLLWGVGLWDTVLHKLLGK